MKDRLSDLKQGMPKSYTYVIEDDASVVIEMETSVIAEFFIDVEVIQRIIQQISLTLEELKQHYSQILSAPGTSNVNNEEVIALTVNFKQNAHIVRTKMNYLEDFIRKQSDSFTNTDLRILTTQHSVLTLDFATLMFEFNKAQNDCRDKLKGKIKRQLEIIGQKASNDDIETMLEASKDGNFNVFEKGLVLETQQVKNALSDIERRHQEIIGLERSIKELHELFSEIAIVVENQGGLMNRIEYNVEQAESYVEHAITNIVIANVHKKKSRRKMIFFVVIGLIIVLVIGIIIGLMFM